MIYFLTTNSVSARSCDRIGKDLRYILVLLAAFVVMEWGAYFSPVYATGVSRVSIEERPVFLFAAWPLGGFLAEPGAITSSHSLETAWFDAHLPRFTGRSLRIRSSESDSLLEYRTWIAANEPECIEGDVDYIESVINSGASRYIPILEVRRSHESPALANEAEIIIRSDRSGIAGQYGVVSPYLRAGGGAQIEYWRIAGEEPLEVIFFESPRETLRHLLVGGIQAAGLPAGWFDRYLREKNRLDLLERFEHVTIPTSPPRVAIFLREDIFYDVFLRTLVAETWLRDLYPNELKSIPPSAFISAP